MKKLLRAIFGKPLNDNNEKNRSNFNNNYSRHNDYSNNDDSGFADTGLTEWESMAMWDED